MEWQEKLHVSFDNGSFSYKTYPGIVIKTNNGSATNILIKDKSSMDEDAVRKQLNLWLKYDYGYNTAQPHYSSMKPLILAEEFLVDEETRRKGAILKDFKFYCVNGNPLYVIVYSDRVPNSHRMKRSIYDMDWNMHQEYLGKYAVAGPEINKPVSFDLMKEMAAKLSNPFKFVRVDFYETDNGLRIGELTFISHSGLGSFTNKQLDFRFGDSFRKVSFFDN